MSKLHKPPTPAELAAFMRANQKPLLKTNDPSGFRAAVELWRDWEQQIIVASKACDEQDIATAKALARISFADTLEKLGSEKTVREYWGESAHLAPGDWAERKLHGFPSLEVDCMAANQQARRKKRATIAALMKHSNKPGSDGAAYKEVIARYKPGGVFSRSPAGDEYSGEAPEVWVSDAVKKLESERSACPTSDSSAARSTKPKSGSKP